MGWCGGSSLMSEIIAAVKAEVDGLDERERIYRPIHAAFKQEDWDTESECVGEDEAFDRILRERHPDWFEG